MSYFLQKWTGGLFVVLLYRNLLSAFPFRGCHSESGSIRMFDLASFMSDALPDTALCIYPGLGPAQ